jgi:hypothetical protein
MLVGAVGAAGVLSFRWLTLVDAYKVNLFFNDQWDFWDPMFREAAFLEKFFHQHGPHFMGVGYLVIDLVARASSWNVRAEAFVLVGLSVVNAALALWLKHRLVGRWHAWDALIPLTILSFRHYSVYLMVSNPSLSVVPLTLVLGTALFWTVRSRAGRYTGVVLLNALAVWTAYTFLSTFVVLLLLALELGRRVRRREPVRLEALGLCAAALPLVHLFLALNPALGAPSPGPAGPGPGAYLRFLEALWANFLVVRDPVLTHATFAVVLVLHGLLARWLAQRMLHEAPEGCHERAAFPVAYLVGYSGLFAAACVVARVGMGPDAAYAARYPMHLVPLFLAGYVLLLRARSRWRHPALALLGLALLGGEVAAYRTYERTMIRFSRSNERWLRAYLATREVARANHVSRFKVYPWDEGIPGIQAKLEHMERHHLGPFAPGPGAAEPTARPGAASPGDERPRE